MSTDLNVFIDVVLSEFKHIKNYHEWHIKQALLKHLPPLLARTAAPAAPPAEEQDKREPDYWATKLAEADDDLKAPYVVLHHEDGVVTGLSINWNGVKLKEATDAEPSESARDDLRDGLHQMRAERNAAVKRAEEADKRLASEERACLAEIDTRDRYSEHIALTHSALGGSGEWSSNHDLGEECIEMASRLTAEVERLKGADDRLRERINSLRGADQTNQRSFSRSTSSLRDFRTAEQEWELKVIDLERKRATDAACAKQDRADLKHLEARLAEATALLEAIKGCATREPNLFHIYDGMLADINRICQPAPSIPWIQANGKLVAPSQPAAGDWITACVNDLEERFNACECGECDWCYMFGDQRLEALADIIRRHAPQESEVAALKARVDEAEHARDCARQHASSVATDNHTLKARVAELERSLSEAEQLVAAEREARERAEGKIIGDDRLRL